MSVTSFPGIILFLVLGRFLITEVRRLFRVVLLRLVLVPASSLFTGGRAQFAGDTLAYDLILDGKCPSPPFKGINVSVGISEDEFEEYVTFGSLNAGGSMCVLCHR